MTSVDTGSDSFAKNTEDFRQSLSASMRDPSAGTSHHDPVPRVNRLPDLRFEQSYLRSIKPYVHVERVTPGELSRDEKGKSVAVEGAPPREVIQVQWSKVAWVTTRDQVISPLVQGALWGVAGHFLRPMMASFFQSFRAWWSKGGVYSSGHKTEGQGVGRLRGWIEGLTSPGAVRHDLSK